MASNISNMLNSKLRFSGLSSGLDTETMIKQLMQIERAKVDKVRQDRTLLEWKRDDYRSVINSLRSFKDEYFDTIKPSTNFRSPSAFASYNTSSGNESIATVKAGAGASSATHTLTVKNLATAATVRSTGTVTSAIDASGTVTDLSLQGKQIDITLDGVKKTISLENYSSIADMKTKLQTAIDNAFGKTADAVPKSKLNVLFNSVEVTPGVYVDKLEFKAELAGSTFNIAETPNNFISSLGFASGQQNYITGVDLSTVEDKAALNGKFKIKLGNDEKEIDLTGLSNLNTLDDIRVALQTKLSEAGLAFSKIGVAIKDNKLELINNSGETLTLANGSTDNNLAKLGFTSGATLTGTSSADINLSANEMGKTFTININGVDKVIEIDNDYGDINSLKDYIQTQVPGITVGVSGNKLVFSGAPTDKIIFKKGPEDSLTKLGFASTDNTSNRISMAANLDSIKGQLATPGAFANGTSVKFTINGTVIDLGKTTAQASINDIMTAVNTSAAGVEMKYDALKDQFTLTSKLTGSSETISIDDANGIFSALGIDQSNVQAGEDAVFDLDGVTNMQRNTNEFTINGVTYTLKSDASPTTEIKINVSANADGLIDKIKGFVTKYNEVIGKINGELSEKRERSFTPLTDEQKESMKEEDIKKWEEKAKSGLLRSDSLLSGIANNMRKALSDMVGGSSSSLAKIGITTGSYEMKGKLVIDETKLKAAINDNIDGVVQLFTQESQYSYTDGLSDSSKRTTRYNESGLAQRLYDIIQDGIRTTRDSKGNKGSLLEKAGIGGDITEFNNILNDSIKEKNTLIDKLLDKLVDKENALYIKFTAMEKALSQMNSQSSWLSQQTSQG